MGFIVISHTWRISIIIENIKACQRRDLAGYMKPIHKSVHERRMDGFDKFALLSFGGSIGFFLCTTSSPTSQGPKKEEKWKAWVPTLDSDIFPYKLIRYALLHQIQKSLSRESWKSLGLKVRYGDYFLLLSVSTPGVRLYILDAYTSIPVRSILEIQSLIKRELFCFFVSKMTVITASVAASKGRVLIIGATGFIGQFVAEASLDSGRATFVLARSFYANPSKAKTIKSLQDKGATVLHVCALSLPLPLSLDLSQWPRAEWKIYLMVLRHHHVVPEYLLLHFLWNPVLNCMYLTWIFDCK